MGKFMSMARGRTMDSKEQAQSLVSCCYEVCGEGHPKYAQIRLPSHQSQSMLTATSTWSD
jgi:hypothetical protein